MKAAVIGVALSLAITLDARADLFQETDRDSALQSAVARDAEGEYYRNARDEAMTSVTRPLEYNSQKVGKKLSRQFDVDKSVSRQVRNGVAGLELDRMMAGISRSPLLLYQYSSPAAADLFKHFHTMAYLKLALFYDDLRGLEQGAFVDLDILRDQAEGECISDKLTRGSFEEDLVDIMKSCRQGQSGAFDRLNYLNGNVFEKILNRFNLRGERKQELLDILPQWHMNTDGYHIKTPSKRIGHVLSEYQKAFREQLSEAVTGYAQSRMVEAQVMAELSLPGVPLTEQSVRDLVALSPDRQAMAIAHMSSQLAYVRTMDRYETARDWLRHALDQPILEEAFKHLVRKAADFLSHEQRTLDQKRSQLQSMAVVRNFWNKKIHSTKMDMIQQLHRQRKGEDNDERASW